MGPRRRELYELLARPRRGRAAVHAEQALPGEEEGHASRSSSIYTPEFTAAPAPADPAAPPPPRGLVISAETGLAVTLAFLIALGTAFWLGYDHGRQDVVAAVQASAAEDARHLPAPLSAEPAADLREHRSRPPALPTGAYVVRLISCEKTPQGLQRARDARAYAAQNSQLQALSAQAFLLANDKAYSVCVGPATRRHAPLLEKLQTAFRSLPGPTTLTGRGPTPFAGLSIEQVGKLGRVIPHTSP